MCVYNTHIHTLCTYTHIVIKVIMKNAQRLRTVTRKRNTSRLKYEKRNPPHSLRI